ncbi:MAG: SDR family oxidoreductase [Legionellaceae bacterium]|nr:SDR family oxidoreductase [Legionellaceae bacterium]
MNILVTGGRGYLGGRLCQFLSEIEEFQLFSGSRAVVLESRSEIHHVAMEWSSRDSLIACSEGMDMIVHCAAMNASECSKDPVAALSVNALGTARLLEAAKATGVKRFIYLSTAHVYGSPLVGMLTEKKMPFPVHPYATSHKAAEDLVLAEQRDGQIEGIVLRLSNAFGPPVDVGVNCWDLLFNDLCKQAITKGAITLRSTGIEQRDFVPITDVCRAIAHLMKLSSKQYNKMLFNIGGGWNPTVYEVALLIAERVKLKKGYRPTINRVIPTLEEAPEKLIYCTERLDRTGFVLDTNRLNELDNLINFCSNAFE